MQLLLRGADLRGFVARHALGFGEVAAQIPDPLAVGRRVAGDGHARLAAAAQAMRVERFQRRRLDQHHVQRAALHGRLREVQAGEQFLVAGAGDEHHALGADVPVVDPQPEQFAALFDWLDPLAGQQAVAGQVGQLRDQAGYVEDQFGEAIDLALEFGVLQRRRQLLALDLVDAAAHRFAGEETGEVACQGAGRPQVVRLGQHAHAGEVQFAVAGQRLTPAPRHVGDGFGGAGQRAVQRVFRAAVDDALGFQALPAAERAAFHQHGGIAGAAQAGVEPEAGDTAADDQDIGMQSVGHARARRSKAEGEYKPTLAACRKLRQNGRRARSVAGAGREQLDHHHAGNDQRHPGDGRQIEFLPVDQRRGDAHQDDAQARPDRVGDADRDALHHQREHPERQAVAADHQGQRQRLAEAGEGFHRGGGDHFGGDGDAEIQVTGHAQDS